MIAVAIAAVIFSAGFLAGSAWTALGARKQMHERRLDIEHVLRRHR